MHIFQKTCHPHKYRVRWDTERYTQVNRMFLFIEREYICRSVPDALCPPL
ncbi:MAG: hypothetical protein ACD_62C00444G0003 [uncultured bacterium]|nr:MAG: hypothetical protein ACD_62C00444G0003 [uncultured bacterium]